MVVLPAYNIGLAELRCTMQSLADRALASRVLLVGPADQLDTLAPLAPLRLVDSLTSAASLVETLATWRDEHVVDFCGVAGIDEEIHFQISRGIAERFGLAFADAAACARASNKLLAKRAFLAEGVPTGRFALLSGPDLAAADRVGFPSVLKVLSGTQSQYLFRNDTPAELAANLTRLTAAVQSTGGDPRFDLQELELDGERLTLDPRNQFLLEAFVAGDEFSCDFGLDAAGLRLLRVARKLPGPHPGLFRGYLMLDEAGLERSGIVRVELEAICRRIAHALGATRGVCMVDFKLDGGAISVLEASIRPGISAFNHLMYELSGSTSLALLVRHLLGEPLPAGLPAGEGAVAYLYPPPPGADPAASAARLAELAARLELIAVQWYADAPEAETDHDVDHTGLLRGYALLRRAGLDDVPSLCELAELLAARGPEPAAAPAG